MKKNIFTLLACIAVLSFAACEDYNKDNFGIDNDANNVTEVANYTADYDGEYPNSEFFVSKTEVEANLATWLNEKFYACDVKSTASVGSVMYSQTIPEEPINVNFKDTLQVDDYTSMGTESGTPGKYKNFDKNMDMNHYINIYLNNKYPYKINKSVAGVAIDYYVGGKGKTNDSTFVFLKEDNVWTVQDVKEVRTITGTGADAVTTYSWLLKARTEVATRIAQMEKQQEGWKLIRLIGGTKAIKLGNEEYALLLKDVVDRIAENTLDDGYMNPGHSTTSEYYYGSSSSYNNINNKYYTWRTHYNPGRDNPDIVNYDNLTDDELQALMDQHLTEGIMTVLLPVLVPTPDSGLSYAISYKVYGGRGDGMYTMTFMYSEQLSAWEQTAGPIKQ